MKDIDPLKTEKRVSAPLPPPTYQPSRCELEEEFDMPGAPIEALRKAFFRPLAAPSEDKAPAKKH